ncbi:hypothetical protein CERSUDRAFT_96651 [Gelatoporia subvermispora B]|uniref:Uncharacterized protein n=1 Tax=Ceriporiopsis subvermispora (strain B) TaxID=914234 RepID=M2QER1_CERS8|nr:hypothetical protein CERSUDRAFT_96651 [Gelatoporia subvermispora B]
MPVVTRSFVVFTDDAPPSPTQASLDEAHPVPIAVVPTTGPLLVFAPDKENINPATGVRTNSDQAAKKRKTSVLATKLHVPPPSKKQKELKEVKEVKEVKRKASSSKSVAAPKTRSSAEKKPKRVSSRKAGAAGTTRTRRSPSLPRVMEEPETTQPRDGEHIAQAHVDSRCYELTVLPLADVSQAYEQAPALHETLARSPTESPELLSDARKEQPVVAESEKTKVERASSSVPSSSEVSLSTPELPQDNASTFSTPDRKKLYTAFTFSSPSPSSLRFAAARASSVERFSDIALQP